ncbi:MAG: zf-HC2 domain-containing protein [Nitrospinae bacterium]|nr:zf-HC2 domain-containing protein [Nitrospinota bacterium]
MTPHDHRHHDQHGQGEDDLTCREIFERLNDYLDQELDPDLCDKIDNHVENCEPCIAFINTLRKTVELFQGYEGEDAPRELPEPVRENLMKFLGQNLKKGE